MKIFKFNKIIYYVVCIFLVFALVEHTYFEQMYTYKAALYGNRLSAVEENVSLIQKFIQEVPLGDSRTKNISSEWAPYFFTLCFSITLVFLCGIADPVHDLYQVAAVVTDHINSVSSTLLNSSADQSMQLYSKINQITNSQTTFIFDLFAQLVDYLRSQGPDSSFFCSDSGNSVQELDLNQVHFNKKGSD